MPIISFTHNPGTDTIWASYRPIPIRAYATKTDSTPIPPIVYCDIYIDDVYYRSISKTYYKEALSDKSEWEFDIQDILQEYLGKFIALNGGSLIVEATLIVAKVQIKLRSSGENSDGFIIPEGTAPIQATNTSPAISGTGTASNIFWIVNSTLQHWDNQDLATHLNTYKNGIWDTSTFPLSHRPNNYCMCKNDSDYFPILTDKIPDHLILFYRNRGQSIWRQKP